MEEYKQKNREKLRILSLSLDSKLSEEFSQVRKRIKNQSEIVNKYTVIFPAKEKLLVELSDNARLVGISGVNKLQKIWSIFFKALSLLRGGNYSVLTVQDSYFLGLMGYLLSKMFNVALEIQVHGFEKKNYIRKTIALFVLPRADSVRVVSLRLKKELIELYKVKPEKITVVSIPPTVGLKQEFSVKEEKNNFVFLYVGRLVPIKNIFLQIKAFAEVSKIHPEARLWIVGDGEERKKLEDPTRQSDLKEKIVFYGWQNEVNSFYHKADVFLLTSFSEGWGVSAVEACVFGLPVIMTDVGCAHEFIKDQENGIIVSIGNMEELKNAMLKIIENDDFRERLKIGTVNSVRNLPSKEEIDFLYKESWIKALENHSRT